MQKQNNIPYLLLFLPIFFTPNGFYESYVSETNLHLGDSGVVFPIYFLFSIYCFFYFCSIMVIKKNVTFYNKKEFIPLLTAYLVIFILSSIGLMLEPTFLSFLKIAQVLTGFFAFFVNWYLFVEKKKDIDVFLKYLGFTYLIFICLHLFFSLTTLGFSTFFRGIQPNFLFFDIYQTHVYYPYIINLICFITLIAMKFKSNAVNFLYIFIYFLYVFSWQVRGAIIAFIVMLIIYVLLNISLKKILLPLTLTVLVTAPTILFFDFNSYSTRFSSTVGVSSLGGRIGIWKDILTEVTFIKFFFGEFFVYRNEITAHNQYLEFFDKGGIVGLTLILILLFLILKSIINAIKIKSKEKLYLSLILFVPLIIDFNVNVPLSNTNPSTFYWLFFFIVHTRYEKERTS